MWNEAWRRWNQNRGYRDSERETVPKANVHAKTREVLRLYFELKLRQRQIARSATSVRARCTITWSVSVRRD